MVFQGLFTDGFRVVIWACPSLPPVSGGCHAVKEDLLDRALTITPSVVSYKEVAANKSLLNTPATFRSASCRPLVLSVLECVVDPHSTNVSLLCPGTCAVSICASFSWNGCLTREVSRVCSSALVLLSVFAAVDTFPVSSLLTPPSSVFFVSGDWCVTAMEERAKSRASRLYKIIDSSDGLYQSLVPTELTAWRSRVNIVFRLPSKKQETDFLQQAEARGLSHLSGHRSVPCFAILFVSPRVPCLGRPVLSLASLLHVVKE